MLFFPQVSLPPPPCFSNTTSSDTSLYTLFARCMSFLQSSYESLDIPSHTYSSGIVFSLIGLVCSLIFRGTFTTPLFAITALLFCIAKCLHARAENQRADMEKQLNRLQNTVDYLTRALAERAQFEGEVSVNFARVKDDLIRLQNCVINSFHTDEKETRDLFKKYFDDLDPTALTAKLIELLALSKGSSEALVTLIKQSAEILSLTKDTNNLTKQIHKKTHPDPENHCPQSRSDLEYV